MFTIDCDMYTVTLLFQLNKRGKLPFPVDLTFVP